jgi:hypothetical protein
MTVNGEYVMMDDATLIQEPFYVLLPPIIEEPLPDGDTVTATVDGEPCTLVRVRKGTEHVLFCVPEVQP